MKFARRRNRKQQNFSNSNSRFLRLESLEDRRLLAGDLGLDPLNAGNPLEPTIQANATPGGQETARVIVQLTEQSAEEGFLNSISRVANNVRQFSNLPVVVMDVPESEMSSLSRLPNVVSVQRDVAVPPALASSVPVINGDVAHSRGFDGTGTTVVIIDTGIDDTHNFFGTGGSRIIAERCFSNAGGAGGQVSLCPNGQATDIQAEVNIAACLDGGNQLCDHGTHVAGIAAGNANTDPTNSTDYGVAPGANIVAIQAFTRFNDPADCGTGPAPCVLSYTSDQLAGLNEVATLAAANPSWNIASVNMSIGGGESTTHCDTDSRKTAIDTLLASNIATVIAAGNNAFDASVTYPACISSAFTVGSTTDADQLSSFTNRGTLLDVFAPGSSITSSIPGGGYGIKQGTSMAAPHVAGALAVLRQAHPNRPISQFMADLVGTGVPITYPSGGGNVTTPRIDVNAAIDANLIVSTTVDESDGDYSPGDLSLREAIDLADGTPYSETISFDTNLFSTPQTITLTEGQIGISSNMAIIGPGADLLTVRSNDAHRVFLVYDDDTSVDHQVFLSGLTVTGGMTNLGGGIYNTEELTVSECYIVNNTAAGPNGFGGGIYTVGGKLTLKNSTVADNIATRGAGLFANSETRVIGSTISGNSASNQGGGIESYDVTLDILQSTITNNSTVNGAGGVHLLNGAGPTNTTIGSSIIAGNGGQDVRGPNQLDSLGYNLIGDGDATGAFNQFTAPGDTVGVLDPMLTPLGFHGGTMPTHALRPGNLAVNAGAPSPGGAAPVAMFSFDETVGATTVVDSISGNNGTLVDGPTLQTAGAFNGSGTSVTFASGSDYIEIPRSVQNDFSFAFWVKSDQAASTGTNWYQGYGLVDGEVPNIVNDFGTSVLGGKFAFGVGNAETTITSTTAINDNRWHHVVATRDSSSGEMKVYVNGIEEGVTTGPTGAKAAAPRLTIGQIQTGINQFEGSIDELSIYDRVLSVAEVKRLAAQSGVDQRGAPRAMGRADIGAFEAFVVDSTSDASDGNYGEGAFGLREAIELTNQLEGPDQVWFADSMSGQTITLANGQLGITSSLAIIGPGADLLTINGNNASRVFNVDDNSPIVHEVLISGMTITGGNTSLPGGGINNRENLTIIGSTITGNTSTSTQDLGGGGIHTEGGTLDLRNSTVTQNAATASEGGGIRARQGAVLNVSNSTISGNTALGVGAGISAADLTTSVTLVNATIVENTGDYAALFFCCSSGSFNVTNSIIANNLKTSQESHEFADFDYFPPAAMTFEYSLVESSLEIVGTGNITGVDPQLGPLANNGGPTRTHALLPGSPAINAGDPAAVAGMNGVPEFDQRGSGFARVVDGRLDIGALEANLVITCDFNGDEVCNGTDIDLLQANIVTGPADPGTFDLNGDGLVTVADRDEWLVQAGAANLPSGNAYRPADANLDGFVDGQDFIVWNGHKFTTTSAWTRGDFNVDGVVDGQDFIIWNFNKFQSSDASSRIAANLPSTVARRDRIIDQLFARRNEDDDAAKRFRGGETTKSTIDALFAAMPNQGDRWLKGITPRMLLVGLTRPRAVFVLR